MKKLLIVLLSTFVATFASAEWHTGKVKYVGVGYDGKTITLIMEGWSRSDCTCYASWPSHMCLDETRETSEFEKAILISARAKQTPISVNIDETTCKVRAMTERD
ncbi:MAG: hypothetical protein MK096_14985 [Oleiphilaceae bacterium]|nr:hypothetical protein [Oleiphilaceae bacterium]